MAGDGCSATCTEEPGWDCTGTPPQTCVTVCGDSIRTSNEVCDNGFANAGCNAGCMTVNSNWTCTGAVGANSTCTPRCGDGKIVGTEACDDQNLVAGDGCSLTCTIEAGFTCTGTPKSTCVTTCGDGTKAGAEKCDDGSDDGVDCETGCTGWEVGKTCNSASPSVCVSCGTSCPTPPWITPTPTGGTSGTANSVNGEEVDNSVCGDGLITGKEECEDGNLIEHDGCSNKCKFSDGYAGGNVRVGFTYFYVAF